MSEETREPRTINIAALMAPAAREAEIARAIEQRAVDIGAHHAFSSANQAKELRLDVAIQTLAHAMRRIEELEAKVAELRDELP